MSGDKVNSVDGLLVQTNHVEEPNQLKGDDDQVDPWNVVSKSDTGVDYDKLIRKY